MRTMRYTKRTAREAAAWQLDVRELLARLLRIDDLQRDRTPIALEPAVSASSDSNGYRAQEIEITATPHRRVPVAVTTPLGGHAPAPAVVCIHGHGGDRSSTYERESIYKGFAADLAASGFVTIAANVGQHEVYENGRTLMGERLWDLMRCVDFLAAMPEVDATRIGCAGLSLGGEMAMWLGAMDTRIAATVSAGFLTRMDQMERNHCVCWKFDGLRELVDFADLYALIAPRALQCQNGRQEPADQFPPSIAKAVLPDIQAAYGDLGVPGNVELAVHEGAHEVELEALKGFLARHLRA